MASSLGGSFGVAISAAIYEAISSRGNVNLAATGGIVVNVVFGILALVSIMVMVPKDAGKGDSNRSTPAPTFYKTSAKQSRRQRATD